MTVATHEVPGYSLAFEDLEYSSATRYDAVKSVFDVPAAVVLLVISAPVVLLAMLVVRLTSRGPAVYTQKRLGSNGRVFTIFKIRTMYLGSEPNGARWSLPGDKRVTPVGRLLRWSHVDELPQLLNVLRGEMSLIGPRPERPEIVAQLEKSLPEYRLRLLVRPGVTGLAQVLLPPDADLNSVRMKLNFDMYYIRRMNPWLDLRIAVGTALHLLSVSHRFISRVLRFPDERLHRSDLS
jgi:lipopolysaccharide/colanic/teichoic acid biosynthesis glycosyltransferase